MNKLLTLLLLVALFAACGHTTKPMKSDEPTDIAWSKPNDVAAVAFVGYFTDTSDFKKSSVFRRYAEKYGLPDDIAIVANKGDEIYLVIPRDPKAQITVNDYPEALLENPDADVDIKKLYESNDGKPFFIKCSSLDGMVNTELRLTDSEGRGLTYHPQISMADGSLGYPSAMPEHEGNVMDITMPVPESKLPK